MVGIDLYYNDGTKKYIQYCPQTVVKALWSCILLCSQFYSFSVHKVKEMFIIMNRMFSVRVKEFSFHLFIKVYRYPVSTRKFPEISVNHKRFGILVYFDGSQLSTSIYTGKASFTKHIFRKDLS